MNSSSSSSPVDSKIPKVKHEKLDIKTLVVYLNDLYIGSKYFCFSLPFTVCNFVGQSIDDFRGLAFLSFSVDFVGDDEEQFLLGDVEAGTVTPGITGKFAGGVLARGDWRICIKNALS